MLSDIVEDSMTSNSHYNCAQSITAAVSNHTSCSVFCVLGDSFAAGMLGAHPRVSYPDVLVTLCA